MDLTTAIENLKQTQTQLRQLQRLFMSFHRENVFDKSPSYAFLSRTKELGELNADQYDELREQFDKSASEFDQYRDDIATIERQVDECYSTLATLKTEIQRENNENLILGGRFDEYEELLALKYKEIRKLVRLRIITETPSQSHSPPPAPIQKKIPKKLRNTPVLSKIDGSPLPFDDEDGEDLQLLDSNKKILLQWCEGQEIVVRYDSKFDGDSQQNFVKSVKGYDNLFVIIYDQSMNVFGCFLRSPITVTNKPIQELFGFVFELVNNGDIHLKKCNRNKDTRCLITVFEDGISHANHLIYFGRDESSGILVLKPFVQNGTIKQLWKSFNIANTVSLSSVERFEARRIVVLQVKN